MPAAEQLRDSLKADGRAVTNLRFEFTSLVQLDCQSDCVDQALVTPIVVSKAVRSAAVETRSGWAKTLWHCS